MLSLHEAAAMRDSIENSHKNASWARNSDLVNESKRYIEMFERVQRAVTKNISDMKSLYYSGRRVRFDLIHTYNILKNNFQA